MEAKVIVHEETGRVFIVHPDKEERERVHKQITDAWRGLMGAHTKLMELKQTLQKQYK